MSREPGGSMEQDTPTQPRKRSWAKRIAELALWAAVAIGTAAIMISLSETLLPANF